MGEPPNSGSQYATPLVQGESEAPLSQVCPRVEPCWVASDSGRSDNGGGRDVGQWLEPGHESRLLEPGTPPG